MENQNPNESPNDDWNSRNCPYDQETTWFELLAQLVFNVITPEHFNDRAVDDDYTEEDSEEDELEHDSDLEEEDYDWLELNSLCDICENQVQDEDDEPLFECQRCVLLRTTTKGRRISTTSCEGGGRKTTTQTTATICVQIVLCNRSGWCIYRHALQG